MLKGVLQGSVLKIINNQPTYGYNITEQLNELGFEDIVEGTVYTILVRLEKNNFVETEKMPSAVGPPRKFYTLTPEGQAELETFWKKWDFISSRINKLRSN